MIAVFFFFFYKKKGKMITSTILSDHVAYGYFRISEIIHMLLACMLVCWFAFVCLGACIVLVYRRWGFLLACLLYRMIHYCILV